MIDATLRIAGLRTFMRIGDRWQLTDQERLKLLGLERIEQLHAAAVDPETLSPEALERISYVLGIFQAINTLLPIPERADGWIRAANSAAVFGGKSPLDRMAMGDTAALQSVRRHLDSQLA